MRSDTIRLTGLSFSGRHGVFDFEKEDPQPFGVDVTLEADLRTSAASDNLADTISYADVADMIEEIVTRESFNLIESLAETIARAVLLHDDRIHVAEITVHKPQAPITQTFADVAVAIRRTRADVAPQISTHRRASGEHSGTQGLEGPRRQVSGVYDGELVDDATPTATQGEEAATYTTPTAYLGAYDKVSLAELGQNEAVTSAESGHQGDVTAGQSAAGSSASGQAAETAAEHSGYGYTSHTGSGAAVHLRDPDLPAAFAVRCVLALGSNLGDSQATLASAVQALETAEGVVVVNASPLARTKPVGGPDGQRDYLNQVVEIETRLSPHELLDLAQQIEADHKRVRHERWGPRTLDVDIVTYAQATIDSPRLQVPHPSAAERAFVLLPWSWMDPVALLGGRPVRELAEEAADKHEVTRLDEGETSEILPEAEV